MIKKYVKKSALMVHLQIRKIKNVMNAVQIVKNAKEQLILAHSHAKSQKSIKTENVLMNAETNGSVMETKIPIICLVIKKQKNVLVVNALKNVKNVLDQKMINV